MVEDKILTRHPQGKKGVNISRAKYDVVRSAITECLSRRELTHEDLTTCVSKKLKEKFEGSIPWYVETIKLDLEARQTIESARKAKQQTYRLKKTSNYHLHDIGRDP